MKITKLYDVVTMSDDVPIERLSIKDGLRALLKKIFYNEAEELDAEVTINEAENELIANLLYLIDIATEPIKEGKHRYVKMKIASDFKPVLKEVFSSPDIQNFYNVKITAPDISLDIRYYYIVEMQVKGGMLDEV